VYAALVHFRVGQCFFHGRERRPEQVHAHFFESGPGDFRIKINAVVQGVDFEGRLGARRQCPFGPLAGRSQPSESSRVPADVFLALPLELLDEMRHQPVVEVFAAQVRVAGRRLHFEQRTLVDGQDGHVERTTAQIEYQHVLLALQVLVETVRQSSSRGLIDYPQHV